MSEKNIRSIKLREADRFNAECTECDAQWGCDDYKEFDEIRAAVAQHVREFGHRVTTRLQRHNLVKPRA